MKHFYTRTLLFILALTAVTAAGAQTYWLSGGYNSWSTANLDAYAFTDNGDGTHTLALDEFYGEFKIITSSGGTWYGYGSIDLDTSYTLSTSGGNISLPSASDTYTGVVMTLTESDGAILLSVSAEGTKTTEVTYYLTGDFNSWATSDSDYEFTAGDDDTYTLTVSASDLSGSVIFKVVTSTSLWLGYGAIDYDTAYALTTSGGNLYLSTDPTSEYVYLTLTAPGDGTYSFVASQTAANVTTVQADAIDSDEPLYDLSGRHINNPTTGIVIQDGKKYLLK